MYNFHAKRLEYGSIEDDLFAVLPLRKNDIEKQIEYFYAKTIRLEGGREILSIINLVNSLKKMRTFDFVFVIDRRRYKHGILTVSLIENLSRSIPVYNAFYDFGNCIYYTDIDSTEDSSSDTSSQNDDVWMNTLQKIFTRDSISEGKCILSPETLQKLYIHVTRCSEDEDSLNSVRSSVWMDIIDAKLSALKKNYRI